MNRNLVISTKAVITFFVLLLVGLLLYQVLGVILQLVIALILALSIESAVKAMIRRKVPRWVAVGAVFLVVISLIAFFFFLAFPVLLEQARKLIISLPALLDSAITSPELRASVNSSLAQLTLASGDLFSFTISIFSNFFSVLTVFIFTLYLSLDLPNLKKRFIDLFSDDLKNHVDDTWKEIEVNLGRWVVGQISLMLAVGICSYVGLVVLGIPYAASLAVISGLLEVVPVLGPVISTVIAGIVGFAISPIMGTVVVTLFIGIQQLENSILVPRIMQRIVGFNPIITMIALLVGGKLFGVVGALLSIPVALVAVVVIHRLVTLDVD